ncbi:uncharacterized protein LOC132720739 [Ruditapes philippinarum]|uniref:uncharacterized protein LOC132720739 n=1 Tax=Ruditapes philippinarum TaxID=129788 RepID=UPI00295B4D9B|nr:uncharacterized protein LOC132720739 [Ruditapes philippinarum]
MFHDQQLKNTKYRNWVKAGLGLKYLGNGLAPLVDDAIKRQHSDILSDIDRTHGARSRCGRCRLETLLPIHTPDPGNKCPLEHRPSCNCRSSRGKTLCPSRLCSAIYDTLIIQHRYSSPNWKNTDVSQWFDNYWQIAKVFIPAGGYYANVAAHDTDCAGLLNIIINNTIMHTLFDTVIDAPNDIFSKTRAARDSLFHSSSLELEDAKLGAILDNMVAILEDEKQLKNTQSAIDARENIRRLRNQNFVITIYNEESIRKSAIDAIKELEQCALESIREKQREVIDEIQTCGLQQKIKKTDELDTRLEGTDQTIQMLQQKQAEFEHSLGDLRNSHHQLHLQVEEINQELVRMKSNELYSKTRPEHEDKLKYIGEKKALQRDLIYLYNNHYRGIPVHPLMQEKELMVDKTFVKPTIRKVKSKQSNESDITSFKDIFCSENKRNQNIYITGKAGIGKSAICKKFISEWCKMHGTNTEQTRPDILDTSDPLEIALEMKPFEFLFFVSLRHCKDEDSLNDMIKNQILQTRRYKDLFERILEEDSDKCLIMLDGLDEWDNIKRNAVPRRNLMSKYSVITTTRPWVLEKLRLKETEIDINIELLEFSTSSTNKLAEIMITHLNAALKRSRLLNCFEKEVLVKNLNELSKIPILLQQMVCVWHDEESLGKSQCDIYSSMLKLLIQVAEHNKKLHSPLNESESNVFPPCFQEKTECITYGLLILSLAKVAFVTLFTDQQLAFPSSQTEICGMSTSQLDQCLAIGILTQNEAVGIKAVTRYKTLAFIHKTFQEFLAALHIAVYARDKTLSRSIFDSIDRSCKSFHDVLSFSLVFKFLCGMNPVICKEISMRVQNVIVRERNTSDSLSLSSTYSKSLYATICGRLIYEANDVITRMNALFLDWIDESKRCGHEDIQLVCSEITDLELYKHVDHEYVQTLSLNYTDLSSSRAVHHKGPLTSLHISDSSFLAVVDSISKIFVRSHNTLTKLHLDFNDTGIDESRHTIFENVCRSLSQMIQLQNVAFTNFRCYNDTWSAQLSLLISNLKLLKSLYLENMGTVGMYGNVSDDKPIDLSSHRHLVHIHILHCDIGFSVPDQVKVICLDDMSGRNTIRYVGNIKELEVLTFLPFVVYEPYMSGMFYKDGDVISSLTHALPSFTCLKHLQISAVDFRGHNLMLSRNLNCLLTLVLNNILIEDGRLLNFLQSTPISFDIDRCCPESPCMKDLFILRVKMVFHDEQDTNTDCRGIDILSDETRKCVQQLIDKQSLVVFQVLKPYKRRV